MASDAVKAGSVAASRPGAVAAVPEPAALALLIAGLVVVFGGWRQNG
jgi:hypothetical protein